LKRQFAIAGGVAGRKRNLIVTLDGLGLGEASGSIKYGPSQEVIYSDLCHLSEALKETDLARWRDRLSDFDDLVSAPALCAFSSALADYLGKTRRKSLSEILSMSAPTRHKTSVTVSIGDVRAASLWRDAGYDILKLKMGPDRSACRSAVEMMHHLPDVRFRIDANGSWDEELAREICDTLPAGRVELIEQPFPADSMALWTKLKRATSVPLFMDESIAVATDITHMAAFIDGVNIKIQKSGRLERAVEAMTVARRAGLTVMLGCMIESAVGIAAAYQLSSLADLLDLDGSLLLEPTPFAGLTYDHGCLQTPGDYGHGISRA
jgi:L-alanine-DL-glutamate epimerase-like enolase superfamily enzyme